MESFLLIFLIFCVVLSCIALSSFPLDVTNRKVICIESQNKRKSNNQTNKQKAKQTNKKTVNFVKKKVKIFKKKKKASSKKYKSKEKNIIINKKKHLIQINNRRQNKPIWFWRHSYFLLVSSGNYTTKFHFTKLHMNLTSF